MTLSLIYQEPVICLLYVCREVVFKIFIVFDIKRTVHG